MLQNYKFFCLSKMDFFPDLMDYILKRLITADFEQIVYLVPFKK